MEIAKNKTKMEQIRKMSKVLALVLSLGLLVVWGGCDTAQQMVPQPQQVGDVKIGDEIEEVEPVQIGRLRIEGEFKEDNIDSGYFVVSVKHIREEMTVGVHRKKNIALREAINVRVNRKDHSYSSGDTVVAYGELSGKSGDGYTFTLDDVRLID